MRKNAFMVPLPETNKILIFGGFRAYTPWAFDKQSQEFVYVMDANSGTVQCIEQSSRFDLLTSANNSFIRSQEDASVVQFLASKRGGNDSLE